MVCMRAASRIVIASSGLVLLALSACAGSTVRPAPRDAAPAKDVTATDVKKWLPPNDLLAHDVLPPDKGPPPCAQSCAGCCDKSGVCQAGTAVNACGKSGALCADCADLSTECKAGICVACQPNCQGKLCGSADGCGGQCQAGSGCCTPNCSGKSCGDGDGCGGRCGGSCPWKYQCGSDNRCHCGPSGDFKEINGVCLPSCGQLLAHISMGPGACCNQSACLGATGGGPGQTWDCNYCCATACQ